LAPTTSIRDEQRSVEFATLLSNNKDRVNVYHNDEPLRYRTLDNIFGDQPVPRLAIHNFEAKLHLANNRVHSSSPHAGGPRGLAHAPQGLQVRVPQW